MNAITYLMTYLMTLKCIIQYIDVILIIPPTSAQEDTTN